MEGRREGLGDTVGAESKRCMRLQYLCPVSRVREYRRGCLLFCFVVVVELKDVNLKGLLV